MISNDKVLIFAFSVAPLFRLLWLAAVGNLGANPVEAVIHFLGIWALVALLVTLSMTPVRLLTGLTWPIKYRRMLGLFAFFYASLHFLAYAGLDQWFDFNAICKDITKHPYVLVGFSAYILLIPLALTSTSSMIKRLGRRWKQLHRLVYLIGILAVVHFWWLVKKDITEPLVYAAILAVLLGLRVIHHFRGNIWLGNAYGIKIADK